MPNSAVTIQCSNPNCQTSNSQNEMFCHQCHTPIIKRYLWMLGEDIRYKVGVLISDRYLVKQQYVVLDTKPGEVPQIPKEIPNHITSYLLLSPYFLNIPQVYGLLTEPGGQSQSEEVWLLEYGTVPTNKSGELKYQDLLPELTQVWQETTALRQLNWLWQMAGLWQSLKSNGVASTLLNPSLLRVNEGIIQLLELESDEGEEKSLQDLGQLWSTWINQSSSTITKFLQNLCLRLQKGQINKPEQLIAILDRGIEKCGRLQKRTYQIFTCTDSGPIRDHNEDACYPPSKTLIEASGEDKPLAIVCDGIGGHEGGEIASNLAINSLRESINNLSLNLENRDPNETILKLEQFTFRANDVISDRNNSEQRQNRQRMGTTLVMAFAHGHEMYLTHVGDSRIYWITSSGCHQVTLDDDLASREVRLGYTLYRDAVQYPGAGALVQALGMGASANLHPTVQRLILDDDCVFLLCSDGLSDYDRVEQYWKSQVIPILQGKKNIAKVTEELVKIANKKNGHDNVTVALVYCIVSSTQSTPETALSLSQIFSSLPTQPSLADTEKFKESSQVDTKGLTDEKPIKRFWKLLLTLLILLGLGGLLYLVLIKIVPEFKPSTGKIPNSSSNPVITSPIKSPEAILEIDKFIKIQDAIQLKPTPSQDLSNKDGIGEVPPGSILKIVEEETDSSQLLLRVCQLPSTNNDDETNEVVTIKEGYEGWIEIKAIKQVEFTNEILAEDELSKCDKSLSPAPLPDDVLSPELIPDELLSPTIPPDVEN